MRSEGANSSCRKGVRPGTTLFSILNQNNSCRKNDTTPLPAAKGLHFAWQQRWLSSLLKVIELQHGLTCRLFHVPTNRACFLTEIGVLVCSTSLPCSMSCEGIICWS